MLSFWIYDLQTHEDIPILKFSPVEQPSTNALETFKGFLAQAAKEPYRFKVVLSAKCDVTTRMINSMGIMYNFAKALLFFHEESTEKNEYLKLFGSFCAMVTSEGATIDD